MIPSHHIESILSNLSDKLAIFLPLANCHMVDFLTFNLWDKVLPHDLAKDLENIAIEDLYKVLFPQEGSIDYLQGIEEPFPRLHQFILAVCALQLGQLDVLSTKEQVYKWLELPAEHEVERVLLGRLMRHQKTHEVEEMSQLIATLSRELQLSWVCDLGAGKGYLSSVLARHYKLNVMAVDCVLSNVTAAQSYQKILQKELNHQQKLKTKNTSRKFRKDDQFETMQEQATRFSVLEPAQEAIQDPSIASLSSLDKIQQNTLDKEIQLDTLSLTGPSPFKKSILQEETDPVLGCERPLVEASKTLSSGPASLVRAVEASKTLSPGPASLVEAVEASKTVSPGSALNTAQVTLPAGVSGPEENGVLGMCQSNHTALKCDITSCPLIQSTESSGVYLCVAKYISKDVHLVDVLHEAIHSECSPSAKPVSNVSQTPLPLVFHEASHSEYSLSAKPVSNVSAAPRLLVSGLHTCGDLACAGAQVFARDEAVAALCSVGCCYHLLTEAFDRDGLRGRGDAHLASVGEPSTGTGGAAHCKAGHGVDADDQNLGNADYVKGRGGNADDHTAVNAADYVKSREVDPDDHSAVTAADYVKSFGTDNNCESNTDAHVKHYPEVENQSKLYVSDHGDTEKVNMKEGVASAAAISSCSRMVGTGEKIRQLSPGSWSSGEAGPAGFPMSSCLVNKCYSLGRNARMIAAQPPARLSHGTSLDSSQSHFWRALLQLVIVSKLQQAAARAGCQGTPQGDDLCGSQGQGTRNKCASTRAESRPHDTTSSERAPVSPVVDCPCTCSTLAPLRCRPVDSNILNATSRGIATDSSHDRLNWTTAKNRQCNARTTAETTPLTEERHISECRCSAPSCTNDSLSHSSPSPSTLHSAPSTSVTSNSLYPKSIGYTSTWAESKLLNTTTTSDFLQEDHSIKAVQAEELPRCIHSTTDTAPDYSSFQLCGCPARTADRAALADYRVGRRLARHCSSFEEYATRAIEKLPATLRGRVEVSGEELRALEQRHRGDQDRLAKMFLLRASLGPAIEGLVLLDRLAFLLQQDCCRAAFLLPLFDPVLSPRCFALLAFK